MKAVILHSPSVLVIQWFLSKVTFLSVENSISSKIRGLSNISLRESLKNIFSISSAIVLLLKSVILECSKLITPALKLIITFPKLVLPFSLVILILYLLAFFVLTRILQIPSILVIQLFWGMAINSLGNKKVTFWLERKILSWVLFPIFWVFSIIDVSTTCTEISIVELLSAIALLFVITMGSLVILLSLVVLSINLYFILCRVLGWLGIFIWVS